VEEGSDMVGVRRWAVEEGSLRGREFFVGVLLLPFALSLSKCPCILSLSKGLSLSK
jgi:hypothetical protein